MGRKGQDTRSFMDGVGDGYSGDVLEWRDDGKVIVFIHPDGFYPREIIWFPQVVEEEEKGKKRNVIKNVPIICPGIEKGDPLAEFAAFLKDNTDIEDDEIVMRIASGKETVDITKGLFLGLRGFDWKSALNPRKEHIMTVVDIHNTEGGLQIVVSSAGLSKAIKKAIESRIEDKGEKKGDPLLNPWAFKFTFNKKAKPSDKYDAHFNDAELTDEIQVLLEADAPDLSKFIDQMSNKEIWDMMKDYMEVDWEPPFLSEKGTKEHKEEEPKKEKEDKKEKEEEPKKEKEDKPKRKQKKIKKIKEEKTEEKTEDKKEDEDFEECPACGTLLPASATICTNKDCGVKFESDIVSCTNDGCDAQLASGTKRCPECGEKQ